MQYGYGMDRGRGTWNGGHYVTSVGCGQGRMWGADSGGGIDYFCAADAYDPTLDLAKAQRGWVDYRNGGGLSIIHGPYCINRNAYPIARGNADRDYWLTLLGV